MDDNQTPRNVVIKGATATATARGQTATVMMTTPLWWYWLDNAVDAQSRAWAARAGAKNRADIGYALIDETREGMMAVTAATHAIEAFAILKQIEFRGAVKVLRELGHSLPNPARRAKTPKGGRYLHFLDDLERQSGLPLDGWKTDVGWLFRLRDSAGHYEETQAETSLHPLGMAVSADQVRYRAESASKAAAVAILLIDEVLKSEEERGNSAGANRRQLLLRTARKAILPGWMANC
jgi:hypothetical protein